MARGAGCIETTRAQARGATSADRSRIARAEATVQLRRMLERLLVEQPAQLRRVSRLHLFGSYARGALAVGDVDVAVELDLGERYRDPDGNLRSFAADTPGLNMRELLYRGASSDAWRHAPHQVEATVAALCDGEDMLSVLPQSPQGLRERFPGLTTLLLWQRGDTLDTALNRIAAIADDPAAGPAAR